jgi:hypothetical protein
MNKLITTLAATLVLAGTAFAAEETLKGKGVCAKCELSETEKCQAAIQVTKDGKTETYYVAGQQGKDLHAQVCKGPKDGVTVTGSVSEKDGKKWVTKK